MKETSSLQSLEEQLRAEELPIDLLYVEKRKRDFRSKILAALRPSASNLISRMTNVENQSPTRIIKIFRNRVNYREE